VLNGARLAQLLVDQDQRLVDEVLRHDLRHLQQAVVLERRGRERLRYV
jgi:hypothetical protein